MQMFWYAHLRARLSMHIFNKHFLERTEMASTHFRIDYLIHGNYKTFYIHSPAMNKNEAWHWATVDAGIGQIPKYRSDKVPRLTQRQAELLGLTHVQWNSA